MTSVVAAIQDQTRKKRKGAVAGAKGGNASVEETKGEETSVEETKEEGAAAEAKSGEEGGVEEAKGVEATSGNAAQSEPAEESDDELDVDDDSAAPVAAVPPKPRKVVLCPQGHKMALSNRGFGWSCDARGQCKVGGVSPKSRSEWKQTLGLEGQAPKSVSAQ